MVVAKLTPTLQQVQGSFKTKNMVLALGHGLLFCHIVVPVLSYLNVLLSL